MNKNVTEPGPTKRGMDPRPRNWLLARAAGAFVMAAVISTATVLLIGALGSRAPGDTFLPTADSGVPADGETVDPAEVRAAPAVDPDDATAVIDAQETAPVVVAVPVEPDASGASSDDSDGAQDSSGAEETDRATGADPTGTRQDPTPRDQRIRSTSGNADRRPATAKGPNASPDDATPVRAPNTDPPRRRPPDSAPDLPPAVADPEPAPAPPSVPEPEPEPAPAPAPAPAPQQAPEPVTPLALPSEAGPSDPTPQRLEPAPSGDQAAEANPSGSPTPNGPDDSSAASSSATSSASSSSTSVSESSSESSASATSGPIGDSSLPVVTGDGDAQTRIRIHAGTWTWVLPLP